MKTNSPVLPISAITVAGKETAERTVPASERRTVRRSGLLHSPGAWVQKQEPLWEHNRLGIAATGILLQVTAAGAMILILGAAGANPFIYTFGIFLAFMADSLAFAQARMRWVMAAFAASIVINVVLAAAYLPVLL